MSKILLVYPNIYEPWMPMGLTHISAYLKDNGHQVGLFDTTCYDISGEDSLQERYRKEGVFKDYPQWYQKRPATSFTVTKELLTLVSDWQPDVVGMSIMTHDAWPLASEMLVGLMHTYGTRHKALVVTGGVVPTITPRKLEGLCHVAIRGEGELMMVGIATHPSVHFPDSGTNYYDGVPIEAERTGRYPSLDNLLYPDWDLMDWNLYGYWPFGSKVYRWGRFDRTRGCPNSCQYCIYSSREYPRSMKRVRRKNNRRMIAELQHYKRQYSLERITFNDDNFLLGDHSDNYEFLVLYREHVGLPFIVTLHAATIQKKWIVEALKEAGCVHASVGIESGSPYIRDGILKRKVSEDTMLTAFDNLREVGIHTSSLNMIGLPYETLSLFRETIDLNRRLRPDKGMCFFFYPYEGTPIRQRALDAGFIDGDVGEVNFSNQSVMKLPHFPPGVMKRYKEQFNIMIRYPRYVDRVVGWLCSKSALLRRVFSKYREDKQ